MPIRVAKIGAVVTYMKDKIFIDTNIFVYSLDKHDPKKMEKARSILSLVSEKQTGVISTQVMQEFYVTATKKLNGDAVIVKGILTHLSNFDLVTISPEILFAANSFPSKLND